MYPFQIDLICSSAQSLARLIVLHRSLRLRENHSLAAEHKACRLFDNPEIFVVLVARGSFWTRWLREKEEALMYISKDEKNQLAHAFTQNT